MQPSARPRFQGSDLRHGSPAAAQGLIAVGRAAAFGAALAVLGDEGAAEETTVDALRLILELREAAPNDPEACVRWWIAATRHLAIDRMRGRLLDPRIVRGLAESERRVRYGLDDIALREYLDTLPPTERAVLAATYVEGRTIDEAARQIGIPASDVAAHLQDVYQRLGAALADAVSPDR